ncbi:MAG: CinA family protein [Rhodospirillaceae bacterium]|nr:CinA family protein [Rhodospirillaceae bacterium]
MFAELQLQQAARAIEACRTSGLRLALAESCTGGLIAACLTSVAGASDVLDRGFVTYANQAKTDLVGVSKTLLEEHGAVSEAVARAMADGALGNGCHISVSVTGIAGPGGGSDEKPVGLVHIAAARIGAETRHERHQFSGDRDQIRMQAVAAALDLLERLAV